MTCSDWAEKRPLGGAAVDRQGTPCAIGTADCRDRTNRGAGRRRPEDIGPAPPPTRADGRHGIEQFARVGMAGQTENCGDGADLDQPPGKHDADLVGHGANDAEVVRNEQVAESELRLLGAEQLEHLSLHRYVERADRLVADDQARLERQCARDHHALALAAGQLMRIGVGMARQEADAREECPTADRRPPSGLIPWTRQGSSMMRPTRMWAGSAPAGSWATICTSRRQAFSWRSVEGVGIGSHRLHRPGGRHLQR